VLKNYVFPGILKVNDENIKIRIQYPNPDMYSDPDMDSDPDPDMDSLLRGMDPGIRIRIRIHHKMSWIRNIAHNYRATSSSGCSVPLFFLLFNFELFCVSDKDLLLPLLEGIAEASRRLPHSSPPGNQRTVRVVRPPGLLPPVRAYSQRH
jgi:hypothetical protein